MINHLELIIAGNQRVYDYVYSQLFIEVHIQFEQTIHISQHALQVGRDELSILHLCGDELSDYLVPLLTRSLMILLHHVLEHLVRPIVLVEPLSNLFRSGFELINLIQLFFKDILLVLESQGHSDVADPIIEIGPIECHFGIDAQER